MEIKNIGTDWVISSVGELTDEICHITPSEYNEQTRYLPESVTSMPGYIRYDVNPYMREIVDCFDINSPVREVNLKKGVQITYTTALESGILYYMGHVKTLPMMYMTADKELASARIENNIIPMINQSDMGHIIRSSDSENTRKTGKTANHIQYEGGGYLVPFGARNADKMRSYSICIMLKDEIDAWPDTVGKDGDPDALSDDRCSGYWERRKIFRGSTPLIKGLSKIDKAYLRGDQRHYMVLCKKCSFPQMLRWSTKDKVGGFKWEMDDGVLVLESVRYCCQNCGEPHYEYDKELMFSPEGGAVWEPTSKPVEPEIRSYLLPALYSPVGMQPWYKCVSSYNRAFDEDGKITDHGLAQVFYNNILAESWEIKGSKVSFYQVSAHRRTVYRLGEIPNKYAEEYSGSPVLMLTCQVDVHKQNLAVSVKGWCKGSKPFLIDYWRFEVEGEEDDCSEISSPVWGRLRGLIEEKVYEADDGKKYRIAVTLIDSGYANDTVVQFCSDYASGVYPILGRDRPAKASRIKEFDEFKTSAGTVGYKIVVDHYKDRLAPVLRREWSESEGEQKEYHFNAPIDTTDKQLKELTVERRREKTDDKGVTSYYWHRPGNARNELWDLLVYGSAAVEIVACAICLQQFEQETVDWNQFWQYLEEKQVFFEE